jgi:uncharacterized protein (TIGR02145 family)
MEEIKIGNQIWMTENLNVEKFCNGDSIPQAETDDEWEYAGVNNQPAWCFYDNTGANDIIYGKLYNWHAVNDPRGLAPIGYHIPTDKEWKRLETTLGVDAGIQMKTTSGWADNGNGTNSSGFSGLPGGSRGSAGTFISVGRWGSWWSSTENNTFEAWMCSLTCVSSRVGVNGGEGKENGFSVRCLRD